MNPSYNAGGPSDSGVKPGAITSGPETTGVEPASRKPTGGRPMGLSGGDFVANINGGESPRKSNKKLLIIAGVVIVVLVVAVVVVMMMQGGNTNNSGSSNNTVPDNSSDSNETEESSTSSGYEYEGKDADFYKYANYLLNDTKAISIGLDLGTYNNKKQYAINTAIADNDVEFMKQTVTLWKEFYKRINSGKDATGKTITVSDTLIETINIQNTMMSFLEKYASVRVRTEEEMWALYNEVGLDATIKAIKNDYGKLQDTSYGDWANWAKLDSEQAIAALELHNKYESFGCVVEGGYKKDCIKEHANELKDSIQKVSTIANNKNELNMNIGNLASDLAENCFSIRDGLSEMDGGGGKSSSSGSSSSESNNSESNNSEASNSNKNSTNWSKEDA